jgi:pectate lyase
MLRTAAAAVALAMGSTVAFTPPQMIPAPTTSTGVQAFPGAQGFGTDTPGGRGGRVCTVTTLEDSGPGSLRSCAEASGPRYVVFRTGGTILLRDRITISDPFVTIAGQTAPGDGITLRMDPESGTDRGTMLVETHDVVIRFLRFRPGDGGSADDSHDALTIYKEGVHDVVVDHCSFSWAIDENVNTYDSAEDITISRSIIAEALSRAGHPAGEHSKGLLAGGEAAHGVSIHHNLFVSNVDRNPQVSGVSVADVRNNVVYNYGDGSGDGVTLLSSSNGEPAMNWVGNYYKAGPDSPWDRPEFATYDGTTGSSHGWYGVGNLRWTAAGDQPARIAGEAVGSVGAPFPAPEVTTTPAARAYTDVLSDSGASLVRDAVDRRLVDEVRGGHGSVKDAAGPYPTLDAGTPPSDSDGDAMPDTFESTHGTDPSAPDATGDANGNGYDNVEDWFNALVDDNTGPRPLPPSPPSPHSPTPTDRAVPETVLAPVRKMYGWTLFVTPSAPRAW